MHSLMRTLHTMVWLLVTLGQAGRSVCLGVPYTTMCARLLVAFVKHCSAC